MKHKINVFIALVLTMTISTVYASKPGKWRKLFDGKTTNGWHTYGKPNTNGGWMAMDGTLMTHGKSGDLVTDEEFENYILEFEFKATPKGNSGLIYKVIEDPQHPPYYSGAEYQIIDDDGYPPFNDGGKMVTISDKQKTAANYDMQPPSTKAVKPAGEWNKGKIVIDGNHIEHWLNGVKVVEYEYGSDTWKEQLAKSKFAKWAYATPHAKGKISLQDHGDSVAFRNIRIKTL